MTTPAEPPEWNMGPISDFDGSQLHWSTVVVEHGRAKNAKTSKRYAFCGRVLAGSPQNGPGPC